MKAYGKKFATFIKICIIIDNNDKTTTTATTITTTFPLLFHLTAPKVNFPPRSKPKVTKKVEGKTNPRDRKTTLGERRGRKKKKKKRRGKRRQG